MNIGDLYDQHVVAQYDDDPFGLLTRSRGAAADQILRHAATVGGEPLLVDFSLGTGESLLAIRPGFPAARFAGIDVSAGMLAAAAAKFDVRTIHDDARNACAHFAPGSADVVLAHFIATYVEPPTLARNAATILRSGGYFSLVNGTMQGFRALQRLALRLMPEATLRTLAPSPENGQALERACLDAGLEVCESSVVTVPLSFPGFLDFYRFGFHAGWFTHLIAGAGEGMLAQLAALEGAFPLDDEFQAAVVLARKP